MSLNNEKKKDVFFHNSINITQWMTDRITNILINNKFTIINLKIDCEIAKRLDQASINNNINLEIKDSAGKFYFLTGYNSLSSHKEDGEVEKWLICEIKKLEKEAVETLGKKQAVKKNDEYEVKRADLSCTVKKKNQDLNISFITNLAPQQIIDYFTKEEHMKRWMLGNGVFEGESQEFRKVTFNNIELTNFFVDKNNICFNYKLKDWEAVTKVQIKLSDMENSTKILVNQKNVPIQDVNLVRAYWHEKIFLPISWLFGCSINQL